MAMLPLSTLLTVAIALGDSLVIAGVPLPRWVSRVGGDWGRSSVYFRSTSKAEVGESYDTSLWFEHGVCQPAPRERQPC